MATQGIEEVTENAIRAVARDCGSLSMECSDVAGYVQDVAAKLDAHLTMLDSLEEVTTRLLADQARVSDSTDEARLLSEQRWPRHCSSTRRRARQPAPKMRRAITRRRAPECAGAILARSKMLMRCATVR